MTIREDVGGFGPEGGGIGEQPQWSCLPSFLPSSCPIWFSLSSPFRVMGTLWMVEGSGPHTDSVADAIPSSCFLLLSSPALQEPCPEVTLVQVRSGRRDCAVWERALGAAGGARSQ